MFSEQDYEYMNRAFLLAEKGRLYVSPNPMVGCVIVHKGEVIGEGYHQKFGEAHAEPNAVNSVLDKSLLEESTVYVTLEPCSHYGKTPPCAELLKNINPKRIVIANVDPNPKVSGRGISLLQQEGITVESGLLQEKGEALNRRFFSAQRNKRPYIIFKWAETQDGFIARENFDSKWISNEKSRLLVHKWRAEEDAIMVGTNTAQYDNPRLNVRNTEGCDPVRVVVDRALKLSNSLNLFDQTIPTIVVNSLKEEEMDNLYYLKNSMSSKEDFLDLLSVLFEEGVNSLIIEGGKALQESLYNYGLWDEARVFIGAKSFGKGIDALKIEKDPVINKDCFGDQLLIYLNKEVHRDLICKEFSFVC